MKELSGFQIGILLMLIAIAIVFCGLVLAFYRWAH